MSKNLTRCSILLTCAFFFLQAAVAQSAKTQATKAQANEKIRVMPNQIQWQDAPASLPAGAKIAVLEGDPSKAGPFTARLLLPANYKVMPHTHPDAERLTIIEGDFYMGEDGPFDEAKAKSYPAGSFIVIPVKTQHYAFTKNKSTIVQIQANGPWDILYSDAKDNPQQDKATKRPGK